MKRRGAACESGATRPRRTPRLLVVRAELVSARVDRASGPCALFALVVVTNTNVAMPGATNPAGRRRVALDECASRRMA